MKLKTELLERFKKGEVILMTLKNNFKRKIKSQFH